MRIDEAYVVKHCTPSDWTSDKMDFVRLVIWSNRLYRPSAIYTGNRQPNGKLFWVSLINLPWGTIMKLLIVIACLIAVITAELTCGPLQRLKVKRQWAASYGHGMERTELGHFIWAQLALIYIYICMYIYIYIYVIIN